MVGVIVREDNVRHAGEIDAELLRVSKHGLGTGTRVDQEAAAVDLEEGRESPLANAMLGVAREHRGEDRDLDGAGKYGVTGLGRRGRSARRERREDQETEGNREGLPHDLASFRSP